VCRCVCPNGLIPWNIQHRPKTPIQNNIKPDNNSINECIALSSSSSFTCSTLTFQTRICHFPVIMKCCDHCHLLLIFVLMLTVWTHGVKGWTISWNDGLKSNLKFSLIFPGVYLIHCLLCNWLMNYDECEGSCHDLFPATIPSFTSRKWRKHKTPQ